MENNIEIPVRPVSLWVVTLIWVSVLAFMMTGFASLSHAQTPPVSCGYTVNSGTYSIWPGGYQAWVEVGNLSGETASDFEILIDIGNSSITDGSLAEYEQVDHGYSVTAPSWLQWQKISQGSAYRFQFNGAPQYEGVLPYIISINGTPCDLEPPILHLNVSSEFFTDDGNLTLSAEATDNTAVRRVIFERDGEVIGEDWKAPFQLEVAVTESMNGFHRYSAQAYDVSGNKATAEPERVFVAIGNKFFGTAPGGPEDYVHLLTYFDQLTPENAGKWGSVESERDVMNWQTLDTAYAFARANDIPFKFHTLVWGQQQPEWIASLPVEEQLAELNEWMRLVAERYPDLQMIEVVNEPLHAPPEYSEALGGAGETGWDWVITAFEMAREYFPKAQLILNDYQILHLPVFTQDYLQVIHTLQTRDLIDAIGLQAHFLERADVPVVAANLQTLAETGLPIYISEFDLDIADDALHANVLRDLFRVFWEHPSVVGVTHWGHLEGSMWRTNGYLIRSDDLTRPALDWLVCYLAGRTGCVIPEYAPDGWQGDEYGVILEAEQFDEGEGVLALGSVVAYTDDADWIAYLDVEFQSTWDTFWLTYAKGNQDVGSITVHLDSLAKAPLLTLELPPTTGWGSSETLELPWSPIAGTHDVFIRFNDVAGVANLDKVQFGQPRPVTGNNLVIDGSFEGSSVSGWQSWNGSTLSITSAEAYTGSQSLLATNRPNTAQFAVYNLTSLVSPGSSYAVSAQTMISGTATDTVRLAAKVECADPPEGHNTYPWLHNNGAVVPDEWTELAATLVIPDCDIVDVAIFFEGTAAGTDVYLDDVSVLAND